MGKTVIGCVLVLLLFFSTQNQIPQLIIATGRLIYHIEANLVVVQRLFRNFQKNFRCRETPVWSCWFLVHIRANKMRKPLIFFVNYICYNKLSSDWVKRYIILKAFHPWLERFFQKVKKLSRCRKKLKDFEFHFSFFLPLLTKNEAHSAFVTRTV